jgi:hypothetical protein
LELLIKMETYRVQAKNEEYAVVIAKHKYPLMKVKKVEVLHKATSRVVGDYRIHFEFPKVYVEGDSSVGMPGYNAVMISDKDGFAEVKDEQGNVDEVPRKFVHTEKDIKEENKAFSHRWK